MIIYILVMLYIGVYAVRGRSPDETNLISNSNRLVLRMPVNMLGGIDGQAIPYERVAIAWNDGLVGYSRQSNGYYECTTSEAWSLRVKIMDIRKLSNLAPYEDAVSFDFIDTPFYTAAALDRYLSLVPLNPKTFSEWHGSIDHLLGKTGWLVCSGPDQYMQWLMTPTYHISGFRHGPWKWHVIISPRTVRQTNETSKYILSMALTIKKQRASNLKTQGFDNQSPAIPPSDNINFSTMIMLPRNMIRRWKRGVQSQILNALRGLECILECSEEGKDSRFGPGWPIQSNKVLLHCPHGMVFICLSPGEIIRMIASPIQTTGLDSFRRSALPRIKGLLFALLGGGMVIASCISLASSAESLKLMSITGYGKRWDLGRLIPSQSLSPRNWFRFSSSLLQPNRSLGLLYNLSRSNSESGSYRMPIGIPQSGMARAALQSGIVGSVAGYSLIFLGLLHATISMGMLGVSGVKRFFYKKKHQARQDVEIDDMYPDETMTDRVLGEFFKWKLEHVNKAIGPFTEVLIVIDRDNPLLPSEIRWPSYPVTENYRPMNLEKSHNSRDIPDTKKEAKKIKIDLSFKDDQILAEKEYVRFMIAKYNNPSNDSSTSKTGRGVNSSINFNSQQMNE